MNRVRPTSNKNKNKMITKTSSTAEVVITPKELGDILTKHFQKEIKMKPTDTDFVFWGDCNRYTINKITFIATKTIEHSPKE